MVSCALKELYSPIIRLTDPSTKVVAVAVATAMALASSPNETCDSIGLAIERQSTYRCPAPLCACWIVCNQKGESPLWHKQVRRAMDLPTMNAFRRSFAVAEPLPPLAFFYCCFFFFFPFIDIRLRVSGKGHLRWQPRPVARAFTSSAPILGSRCRAAVIASVMEPVSSHSSSRLNKVW